MSDDIIIEIEFWKLVEEGRFDVGIQLIDETGTILFNSNTGMCIYLDDVNTNEGLFYASCVIPKHLLNMGRFGLNVNFTVDTIVLCRNIAVCFFGVVYKIISDKFKVKGKGTGSIKPMLNWELKKK